MKTELIIITTLAIYLIVYIVLVTLSAIHDKHIWKNEGKVSSLSMDVSMLCMFWPLTIWFQLPKYLKNKEHYKYGVPLDDLI